MSKQKQVPVAEHPQERPGDRERKLFAITGQVVDLLVDLQPFERELILAAVHSFFPSKLTVRPSPMVGGLP